MSLAGVLSIANSGLANVSAQLALVSHNVANASTPGYAVETLDSQSVTAGGIGMGVLTGPAVRAVNQAMQGAALQQGSAVAGLQTTQTALQSIDAISGTPGQGSDLGSLLGDLQNQFSTLLSDPSNPTQQSAVVSSAATLAQGINTLSNAYTTQRQTAENGIVAEVGAANSALGTIGSLSAQIVAQQQTGQSTADLESQRDAAVQNLSQLVSVNVMVQPNGNMVVTTAGGTTLPTYGSPGSPPATSAGPLSVAGANVQPGSTYPSGGIGGIMVGGVDVTRQLTGGQLGANIVLRDTTLPTYQAELDEFSQNTASQFAAQGLTLFTDPTGSVPAGGGIPVQSGYVGFAAEIQVNPTVLTDPSLVVNGNTTVAGSPTGSAAFTPNPAGGPAGFSTLITNVLNYTFGADAQPGVPQPAANTTGLGAAGTLTAPFAAPQTLAAFAEAITGAEANDSANTTTQLATEQAVQTTLTNQLSSQSGVNLDQQMSLMIQLQNAYGANAKVMSVVQNSFSQLLNAVVS